ILLLGLIVTWQALKIRRLLPVREAVINEAGFAWVLADEFWSNWRTVNLREMSPDFLRAAVRGPFCIGCMTDLEGLIGPDGKLQTVCRCGEKVGILWNATQFQVTRDNVYLKAQAAARREAFGTDLGRIRERRL